MRFLARPETMNEYILSDQPGKIKMIIIDKAILSRIVLEDPDNIVKQCMTIAT